ncbi:hypothetical protein HDU76_004249 [Blyttiomyces sp. JEL0837]|nr:hypothetical protein HDU76_004249 [Blyttiomyces sp. JEL0837]
MSSNTVKGIGFVLFGSTLIGIGQTVQKYAINRLTAGQGSALPLPSPQLPQTRGARSNRADQGKSRVRDPIWILGILLSYMGEIFGNWFALSYVSAAIVTPLGIVSVVIAAFLSSRFLGENITMKQSRGYAVIIIAVLGILIIAPKDGRSLGVTTVEVLENCTTTLFIAGFCSIFVVQSYLIYQIIVLRRESLLILVAVCSLFGAINVTAGKIISVLTRLSAEGAHTAVKTEGHRHFNSPSTQSSEDADVLSAPVLFAGFNTAAVLTEDPVEVEVVPAPAEEPSDANPSTTEEDSLSASAKKLDESTKIKSADKTRPASKDTTRKGSPGKSASAKSKSSAKKSSKETSDGQVDNETLDPAAAETAGTLLTSNSNQGSQVVLDEAGGDVPKSLIEEEEDGDMDVEEAEEGWETDLNIDVIIKRKGQTDTYINACKNLGIVPVSYFAERTSASEIVLRHHGLGVKGAQAVAAVLENNNTITCLDLSNNWIESGGAYIGRSLQINRTLAYLNLTDNRLGLQGGLEMAEMLSFNGSLKTLILKGNSLGDKEATSLAEGLRQNSTLQTLDISNNKIGDLGAIALGSGLIHNDSLKELNLGWNEIRARGIAGFCNNAKENNTLGTLALDDNGITDNAQGVGAFLQKSNSIMSLSLRFVP